MTKRITYEGVESIFATEGAKYWPHRFAATMVIRNLAGGKPSDPEIAQRWIESRTTAKKDLVLKEVAELMVDRGLTKEQAEEELKTLRFLKGFLRERGGEHDGELYIEGYQLKAAIREAASIAVASENLTMTKWGKTGKWCVPFVKEHIVVPEEKLYLGITEPDRIVQNFPQNRYGQTGIQLTEVVDDAVVDFTVESDFQWPEEFWPTLWSTAERASVGAMRAQGYGRFKVVRWEPVGALTAPKAARSRKARAS